MSVVDTHRELAREAAREAIVLLKNADGNFNRLLWLTVFSYAHTFGGVSVSHIDTPHFLGCIY